MLSRDLASTAHCWLAAVGLANKPSASPPVRAERRENTIICYIPVRIWHVSHNALYWCSSATQSIVVCNILTEFYWEFKNDDLWDTLYYAQLRSVTVRQETQCMSEKNSTVAMARNNRRSKTKTNNR